MAVIVKTKTNPIILLLFLFHCASSPVYAPASTSLVDFLDACIRVSAPDKITFPSTCELARVGVDFGQYSTCLAQLGDAVERRRNQVPLIRGGYTLAQPRKMAAGQDLFK